MKEYFTLQFRRALRIIRDFGINPWLGFVVGAFVFFYMSLIIFQKISYPQYFYSFLSLIFIFPLGDKSRNEFLKIIFTRKKYFYTRLIENLISVTPFFFFLLFKAQYTTGFIAILLSALLSLFNMAGRASFVIPSPFSKRPFEFTTGFRRTWWLLFILLIITVISIVNRNFNLGMFCLICEFLVFTTYYPGQEPIFYVWIYAATPEKFLKEKIRTALKYSFLTSLFIAVPISYFFPAHILLVALTMLIGLLFVVLIVVGIYSNYPVHLRPTQIFLILLAIAFPPFLLYVIPNLYLQSVRRLNPYLNAKG
jgi:hypothetical protein